MSSAATSAFGYLGVDERLGAVSVVISFIAISSLVWVLVLMGRQRREVDRANELLALSRELRHRYDALQSVTKEGVLVVSLDGTLLDISERAATILGVDGDASIGRRLTDLPWCSSTSRAWR